MNRLALFLLMIGWVVSGLTQPMVKEFTINNEHNQAMVALYVDFAHDLNPEWGENILTKAPVQRLKAGDSIVITLTSQQDFCHYDILAIWEDGSEQQASSVDVCTLTSWSFK